jgi:hypothetical protein
MADTPTPARRQRMWAFQDAVWLGASETIGSIDAWPGRKDKVIVVVADAETGEVVRYVTARVQPDQQESAQT